MNPCEDLCCRPTSRAHPARIALVCHLGIYLHDVVAVVTIKYVRSRVAHDEAPRIGSGLLCVEVSYA
jgi:hypothetical protein